MNTEGIYISSPFVLSPFGAGIDQHLQALINNQAAYSEIPGIYGQNFPVKVCGLMSKEHYQHPEFAEETKSEKILNQILHHYVLAKESQFDHCFLLFRHIDTFEQSQMTAKTMLDELDFVAQCMNRHGINLSREQITTIDNTCTTGLTLLTHAAQGIKLGLWKKVLIIAMDLIDPYVLYVLQGLGAFAVNGQKTEHLSRPFDQKRSGFIKTESASALILSKDKSNDTLAEIISYSQTNDGHKLTDGRDDVKEVIRSIKKTIELSGINEDDLAFIKSHGTATTLNDEHEALAITKVFQNQQIPVTSLKGHLGHTTDASGLIETILAAAALKQNIIPPTKNCDQKAFDLNIITSPVSTQKKYFLSHSFGFGGNNAAAIFKKI